MFVGAAAFTLSLNDPNAIINAFDVVRVNIDYTAANPEGAVLPLELKVTSPSDENFQRTFFRRVLPDAIFFKPVEGGPHTVALREVGHNQWVGSITVDVQGDELNPEVG